jgi:hypothetical protein
MFPLACAASLFWIVTPPHITHSPAGLHPTHHVASIRPSPAPAQTVTGSHTRGPRFFVSWGYNGDSYTKSDLHIRQQSLGSDFTLVSVQARDSKPWTSIFNHSLFVPQYNVRAGFFFNERWGIELALDHFKWIVKQGQEVRITGTLNGAAVDSRLTLTPAVLKYQLNNGANPIFVNAIRRVRLRGEPGRTGSVSFLAKAGGGFAVPHTENILFSQPNEKGFQFLHGLDVDASAAVRVHVLKRLYVEAEGKGVYARYFGVKVDQGTARHSVKAGEFTFNVGLALN